jgi:hypothetical protein
MTKIIDIKSRLKPSTKETNKETHKLNIKISYMANLTDLINEADSGEYDDKLEAGITHKVTSMNGNTYIITLTKVPN